jgi:hypothetical protein
MFSEWIDYTQKINFKGDLAVGFFFLALGIPLALYTGLVASRVFAFFQARYRTMQWIVGAQNFFSRDFASPHDLNFALVAECHPIISELKALGHDKASLRVAGIWNEFIKVIAQTFRVAYDRPQIPNLPTEASPAAMLLLKRNLLQFANAHRDAQFEIVSTLKPNLWPLITPHPFPNYVSFRGKLIGMMVPRHSPLQVIWAELKAGQVKEVRDMLELAGRRSDCGNCCENCKRTI